MPAALLVALIAAVVTAAVTPLVVRLVWRLGAVDVPADPRKVHTEPVPTMGGLAMVAGLAAGLLVAFIHPEFREVFTATSQPIGLLLGVVMIALLGVADDLFGLAPTVKLAGQIVAALGPVLFGIQLVYVWVPGVDVVAMAPDLGMPLTVLLIVVMINAVNLIDGLDGLAAGIVAIAAMAFFAFTVVSGGAGLTEAVPSAAPMIAAITAGVCVGFLVHNWHPAKIFMGDTGSMTLGLLLASAGVSYIGRSTVPTYTDFAGSIPLLIPMLVLAIPFVDTAFTVIRRAYRRQPISMADRGHLHHLLITFGHSHRRAVIVLYYWSAVIAGGVVAGAVLEPVLVLLGGALAVVLGLGLTVVGIRWRAQQEEPVPAAIDRSA
jgi:UDP-GlcNAc:undecaprenyl-phosphate/decaprenyl-phosphate GlcNAc-1-phosphate transferase